jgi:protein O-GlcNAc transferase
MMSANNPHPEMMPLQQSLDLALQHLQAGKLDQARDICQRVLGQHPNHPRALHISGKIAIQEGRLPQAVDLIRRTIAVQPSEPIFRNTLGMVLSMLGRTDEAVEAYRDLLKLKPHDAEAHNNLGNLLTISGRYTEAINAYRAALKLNPQMGLVNNNLGNVFQAMGLYEEAIEDYRTALKFNPDYPEAHNNLGVALFSLKRFDEAIGASREALRLKPDYADAYINLGSAYKSMGRIEEAITAMRTAMRLRPDTPSHHSMLILTMHLRADADMRAIRTELKDWNQKYAEPLKKFILPHLNDKNSERRLKIGYLSTEFREHVVGWNLLPLLGEHDHKKFEIFCYASVTRPDESTERIRSLIDVWRNIAGINDRQAAGMIRDDKIDILVDLTLHTPGNRLQIFAFKPAPVQVTWLGYAGSTGLDTIDYRFSDPYLDPPGTDLNIYSEQTVRLPETYWCYRPGGLAPDVGPAPVIAAKKITFGSMNNFVKVSDAAAELWMQILKAVPNSRLLIYAHTGPHRETTRERFVHAGILRERIEFISKQPWPDYMNTYKLIDIALDPFPYNGGITTCDSLLMGVPVISLSGPTAFGRSGTSLLTNVGLTELIAHSAEEYVQIATKLAGDLPRLAELRRTLRQRLKDSPLMDAKRFAQNIEAAYREMFRNWCAGAVNRDENR